MNVSVIGIKKSIFGAFRAHKGTYVAFRIHDHSKKWIQPIPIKGFLDAASHPDWCGVIELPNKVALALPAVCNSKGQGFANLRQDKRLLRGFEVLSVLHDRSGFKLYNKIGVDQFGAYSTPDGLIRTVRVDMKGHIYPCSVRDFLDGMVQFESVESWPIADDFLPPATMGEHGEVMKVKSTWGKIGSL